MEDNDGHEFCDAELEPYNPPGRPPLRVRVKIPKRGISDWFEEGLQQIFKDADIND